MRGIKQPDVRVNASGCLGHCEEGITAVMYPQGEWKLNLTPSDTETLVDWVAESSTSLPVSPL